MRSRTPAGILAIGTTTALLGLAGSPATAAEPVTQADASALRLSVADHPAESGIYRVSHDGTRQSTSGTNQPAVRLLEGQGLAAVGTLAQNATARVDGGDGFSAACAGLAGDGATAVEVGRGDCLVGGDNVQLSAGDLRLPDLSVVAGQVGDHLPPEAAAQLEAGAGQLQDGLAPVTAAIDQALAEVRNRFGQAGLFLDLGAVQAHCTARPGEASGDATIAGVAAYLNTNDGQRIDLVRLPVHPAPNTKVVTGLDKVADAVLAGVSTQLQEGLEGALAPLDEQVAAPAREAIVKEVLAQVAPQLAPLEKNVLDATLNRQVRPRPGAIEVTALDLRVLPAAHEQLGFDLVHLEVGRVGCGPSGRVAAPAVAPAPALPQKAQPLPAVPTAVPAGLPGTGGAAAADADDDLLGVLGLGGLLAIATAAGTVALRRSQSR